MEMHLWRSKKAEGRQETSQFSERVHRLHAPTKRKNMSGVGSEFRQWALLLPFSGNWKVPGLKRLTGLFSIVTAFANSGEILVVVIPLSLLRNQWCISATTIKHSHATYTNAGNHTIDMNLMSLQRCARSIDARHPFLPLFLLLLFALLALSPRTQKKCCFVCVSTQTHINWWP